MITYEYPLNERIRTLLRLEDLFERSRHFIARTDPLDHHVALLTLFEILEVAEPRRPEVRPAAGTRAPEAGAAVVPQQSRHLRGSAAPACCATSSRPRRRCSRMTGKIGQYLRENEWLMSIKQRTGIPGGACEFDLPSYHYWLHRPGRGAHRPARRLDQPALPAARRHGDHPAHPARVAASRRASSRRRARSSRCSAARPRRWCACAWSPACPACRRSAPTSTCSTSASSRRTARKHARQDRRLGRRLRTDVLQSVKNGPLPALRRAGAVVAPRTAGGRSAASAAG